MLVSRRRPRRGEEEGVLGTLCQRGTAVAQVAADVMRSVLAKRHGALLPALSADVDRFALEVDVGQVERHGLGAPEPTRVHELEQRAVAESERRLPVRDFQERVDLRDLRSVGKPARAPGRKRAVGDARGTEGEAQARADRGQPPRDRARRQPASPPAEVRDVVGEDARVDLVEYDVALGEPARERGEVRGVRTPGRIGEPAAREEALDRLVGGHPVGFAAAGGTPSAAAVLSLRREPPARGESGSRSQASRRASRTTRTSPSWSASSQIVSLGHELPHASIVSA